MSAEAPKGVDISVLIIPRRSEGRISRFLNRLLGEPPVLQSTSRIVQPPPGLEGFATQIQQGIDGYLLAQRQQELIRQDAEAVRMATVVADRVQAVAKQREFEEQERIKREVATREATEVLRDFQILEKLRYIQKTVWGGKGEIRPIEPEFGREGEPDKLGGVELVYFYPGCREIVQGRGEDGAGYLVSKYVQVEEDFISFSILVFNVRDSEEGKKELNIVSVASELPYRPMWMLGNKFFEVRIPVGTEETKALLDTAFTQETVQRLGLNLVPQRLEREAKRKLVYAAQNPGWHRCLDGVLDSY